MSDEKSFEEKTVEELRDDAEQLQAMLARVQEREGILTGVAEAEARKAAAVQTEKSRAFVDAATYADPQNYAAAKRKFLAR